MWINSMTNKGLLCNIMVVAPDLYNVAKRCACCHSNLTTWEPENVIVWHSFQTKIPHSQATSGPCRKAIQIFHKTETKILHNGEIKLLTCCHFYGTSALPELASSGALLFYVLYNTAHLKVNIPYSAAGAPLQWASGYGHTQAEPRAAPTAVT